MNCSKCGSANCRSFDMLHQAGSATATHADVLGAVHSQTALAKRCQPPSNVVLTLGAGAGMLAGLFALPTGCMMHTMKGGAFPGNVGYGLVAMLIAAAVVIGLFILLSRVLGLSARHDRKMREWENSFLCVDCGKVMTLEAGAPL